MKLVDANIIIRFLTNDHKRKATSCRKLFESVVKGKVALFITDMTIAEVVWVLEKVYKCHRQEIRLKIEAICNTPNLHFQNKELILESIILYDLRNIDFIDAYHAAFMNKEGIKEIYSYDTHFNRLTELVRLEP